MANRWGFLLANQERGGNSLSQSEERSDFKKRDFKNIKVILLSELENLAGGVIQYNSLLMLAVKKHLSFYLPSWH